MDIQHIESFAVVGLVTRTTNASEADPCTAKIAKLWETFCSKASPQLNSASKVYGVYTNYESDFTGEFDVIACADNLSPDSLEGSLRVQIESGKYLTFTAQGEMPKTVISLWAQVWRYFNSSDCEYSRAYTTDFEYYKSESEVEILISIR